jgi:hypothetical protein
MPVGWCRWRSGWRSSGSRVCVGIESMNGARFVMRTKARYRLAGRPTSRGRTLNSQQPRRVARPGPVGRRSGAVDGMQR